MQLKPLLNAALLLANQKKNVVSIESTDANAVTAVVIQAVTAIQSAAANHKYILPDIFIKKFWQIIFLFQKFSSYTYILYIESF